MRTNIKFTIVNGYTNITMYREFDRYSDNVKIKFDGEFEVEQTTNILLEELRDNIDKCIYDFILKSNKRI